MNQTRIEEENTVFKLYFVLTRWRSCRCNKVTYFHVLIFHFAFSSSSLFFLSTWVSTDEVDTKILRIFLMCTHSNFTSCRWRQFMHIVIAWDVWDVFQIVNDALVDVEWCYRNRRSFHEPRHDDEVPSSVMGGLNCNQHFYDVCTTKCKRRIIVIFQRRRAGLELTFKFETQNAFNSSDVFLFWSKFSREAYMLRLLLSCEKG